MGVVYSPSFSVALRIRSNPKHQYQEMTELDIRRLSLSFFIAPWVIVFVLFTPFHAYSDPNTSGYLFTYFTDTNSSVHFAYSTDGLHFTALNQNNPILSSTIGTRYIRDPFIIRGNDGVFHLLGTDNWSSRSIVIYDSLDLISWTNERLIEVAPDGGTFAWAPEAFYDHAAGTYYVYFASNPVDGIHKMYYATTSDFKTFSSPAPFYDPGTNCYAIDGTISSFGDMFYMFFKYSDPGPTGAGIQRVESDDIAGPWNNRTGPLTDVDVEGPTLFKNNTENIWYLYYDYYTEGHFGCATTTDLSSGWTTLSEDDFSLPEGIRHGNVIPITTDELERLKSRWEVKKINKIQSFNYQERFVRHIDFEARIDADIDLEQDAYWNITPGLSDATCVSFESVNYPGYFLKQSDDGLILQEQDGSKQFNNEATFCIVPGLYDSSWVSFQSYADQAQYIRHYNYVLKTDTISTDIEKMDATFRILEGVPGDNPRIDGLYADPHIAYFNGQYYIYPTTDGIDGWGATAFKCFSSRNLQDWHDNGIILDLGPDVSWADARAWAPCIIEKDGTYYYYFSADAQIGVATSDSPTGPFKDALGKPLVTSYQYDCQSIDPFVFTDSDGRSYLYFGQGKCMVVQLNEDMISFYQQPVDITPPGYNEGTFLVKRNDTYYLLWSEDDTRSENYQVAYATSSSPTGPFVKQINNPILSKNLTFGIKGTGHNSVIQIPGKDEWYIVYHRFSIPDGNGTNREVCIDPMYFNPDGTIKKVDLLKFTVREN
jgi:beta-xylosidase